VLVLFLLIYIFRNEIAEIISFAIFLKFILLLILVASFQTSDGKGWRSEMITEWRQIAQPMLLGSVAIGGITQVLPFLYRSFYSELRAYSQKFKTLLFIGSIVLGLTICAIFNIYWCFVIVNVVPQREDQCGDDGNSKDQNYLEPGSGSTAVCYKNNTLQYSLDNGQVITIILDRLFPDTGFNIQPLVAFSVIIAFITIGSSFLDSIFGFAKNIELTYLSDWTHREHFRFYSSAASFGVILIICLFDPKGFLSILERMASASLNITASVFLRTMLSNARYMTLEGDHFPFTGICYEIVVWTAQFWFLGLFILNIVTVIFGNLLAVN